MIPVGDQILKTYTYGDTESPVSVLTLASDYEKFKLYGYAIIGSCYTENLGVEMAITDMLKLPDMRYLIMCGEESLHLAGDAFRCLHENGASMIGTYRRIIGCKSPLPFIDDIPEWAIDAYMEDIILIDMAGVVDEKAIQAKIDECIDEYRENPVRREPADTGMPVVDTYTWKRYAPIMEAEMMKRIKG
jgi:tetrahydromethanopterin S-methyltransferase subunit A